MKKLEVNKIIQGDCLEVMKDIPNGSIDLIVTDPPFGIKHAKWDFVDFDEMIKKLQKEFLRILKDGCLAFIWMPKNKIYELSKFKFKYDVFIETKNFAQGRPHNYLIDCWVPILMLKKGKDNKRARSSGKNWFMVNSANTSKKSIDNPRNILHPTVKDIKITEYLIDCCSLKDDLILDPFLGSGTTAVACKRLGRNYIGIEINPEYCKIAEQRLAQQVLI